MTDGELTITPPPDESGDEEDGGGGDVEEGGGAAAGKSAKRPPQKNITVGADGWAYFPPGWEGRVTSARGASLVAFERIFAKADADPKFLTGRTGDSPLLPTAPEAFRLRKLLPQTGDYDFNVHVMDFSPGEFLEVKEVHYNQHGMIILQASRFVFVVLVLLFLSFPASRERQRADRRPPPRPPNFLLILQFACLSETFQHPPQGQGIYRLGDRWIPVQAGDVVWMAPFVPQWYAALGKENTRYLLYKDVGLDPLVSP